MRGKTDSATGPGYWTLIHSTNNTELTIRELSCDDPRWIALIGNPEANATAFHHPAWSAMLSECYGFRPTLLAAVDSAGEIHAGIPCMELRMRFGFRELMSLPFTDHCPPVFNPSADALRNTFSSMLDHWRTMQPGQLSLNVHAELAEGDRVFGMDRYCRHTTELCSDPELVYKRFDRPQVQRSIKASGRHNIRVVRSRDWSDMMSFYDMHTRTRRRLGVPVQPIRFFRLLWQHLMQSGLGHVALALHNDTPVAGILMLQWGGTLTYKFSAMINEGRQVRANHALVWDSIRQACDEGLQRFDWGRTDLHHEGLRKFKQGWGGVEEQFSYTLIADEPPKQVSGERIRRILSGIIRHSPLWVCRATGGLLYRFAA